MVHCITILYHGIENTVTNTISATMIRAALDGKVVCNTREFKITTTATATGTSLNKRFNEQNNACTRAL